MDDGALHGYVAPVRHWVERVVIAEGLCPFAAPVSSQIRYVTCAAQSIAELLSCLEAELSRLISTDSDRLPTTLIIVPHMLEVFDDYLDAVELVELAIDSASLGGVIQVASFHPNYRFDGTDEDDPSNYTNRSPWPLFHLLREEQVAAAIASHPDIESVPRRNIERFRELGIDGVRGLLRGAAEEA